MGPLKRAVAALHITGDDLRPRDISAALGAEPTVAHAKGDALPLKSAFGVRMAKTGVWSLRASVTEPEDLDAQVKELLGCLTSDPDTWRDLSSRFHINLSCGWFLGSANEGIVVAPSTLSALGERSIELSLDIYERDKNA